MSSPPRLNPSPSRLRPCARALSVGLVLWAPGCRDNPSSAGAVDAASERATDVGGDGQVGGPIAGAVDMHCGTGAMRRKNPTDPAVCTWGPDGGADDGGAAPGLGETMYNAEGDDDDCKYHLKFTVTPIVKGGTGTFTVVVTRTVDDKPATGANLELEAFLSDTHVAPAIGTMTESPPGTYTAGPVAFDASGRWTVRFHLFGDCTDDTEVSQHGHGAFYINVP